MNAVIEFLKQNWEWFARAAIIPFLIWGGKMFYKRICPISLKIFGAKFGLRNLLAGQLDDGTPIMLSWANQLEGYFSITVIRRPRFDEFDRFCLEIPSLNKTIDGNITDLLIHDNSPSIIVFSVGLLTEQEQEEWKAKLVKGTKIILKIEGGWRHRFPIIKQIILS